MNNFDFSGVHIFWEIIDILLADCEPTLEEWDTLFSTPGYTALLASEFTREFFINKFRLAYKPSLRVELNKILDNKKDSFLLHYLEVESRRAELLDYEISLKQHKLNIPLEHCMEWLPFSEVISFPPVSYVIFCNDGRGYNPIVIDLLASIKLDKFIQLFLAHEFHHFYRNQHLAFSKNNIPKTHSQLFRVLDQIQCEGIADCIDKTIMIQDNHPFAQGLKQKVSNAPEYLTLFEETLYDFSQSNITVEEAGRILNDNLPQSGHPIGYYMAQHIIANGLKDEMINSFADCIDFFNVYHRATIGHDTTAYKLKDQTIDILNTIV